MSHEMFCPRCGASLRIGDDGPECFQCGYVDYEYIPAPSSEEKSIVGSGTRYVLRYLGESPELAETLAYVKLRRVRNHVDYEVECPFCGMPQLLLSGSPRLEVREAKYVCAEGHRVSLTSDGNGTLGWK